MTPLTLIFTVASLTERILTRAGYGRTDDSGVGWFELRQNSIEIHPGQDSYFPDDPVLLGFEDGRLRRIVSLRDDTRRTFYELEPELITSLFNRDRERRRIVRFEDIPEHLVDAVLAYRRTLGCEGRGARPGASPKALCAARAPQSS